MGLKAALPSSAHEEVKSQSCNLGLQYCWPVCLDCGQVTESVYIYLETSKIPRIEVEHVGHTQRVYPYGCARHNRSGIFQGSNKQDNTACVQVRWSSYLQVHEVWL